MVHNQNYTTIGLFVQFHFLCLYVCFDLFIFFLYSHHHFPILSHGCIQQLLLLCTTSTVASFCFIIIIRNHFIYDFTEFVSISFFFIFGAKSLTLDTQIRYFLIAPQSTAAVKMQTTAFKCPSNK